jgi:NAD-dependent deacetylase
LTLLHVNEAVRERLHAALRPEGLTVLTGAGMSAESGIATFRDAMTGLWSRFDPAELASVEGYRAQPQRVWQWYRERRDAVRGAEPNHGHLALADFDRRHPGVLTIVTQNVDDLHQRAGNRDVIRLHGNILEDRWLDACPRVPPCAVAAPHGGGPAHCTACGNRVRPGVVWFGELLPEHALERAEHAAGRCAVMLVVGTSGAVWPAAGLAGFARRAGAWVAIVNPHESEIDAEAHEVLRGTAAGVLPGLLAA